MEVPRNANDIIGNGNREVTMLIADTAASNSIRSEANERRKAEMLKIWRRTIGRRSEQITVREEGGVHKKIYSIFGSVLRMIPCKIPEAVMFV